jgi:hypothetical protein
MEIWYDEGIGALAGQIESTEGSNAVYFPAGTFPLVFDMGVSHLDLSAWMTFETPAASNSFGKDLSSVMRFSGTFEERDDRWLSGTYAETITGAIEDASVVLKGNFRMLINR